MKRMWRKPGLVVIGMALVFMLAPISNAWCAEHTIKAVSAWPKTVFEVQNFMKFLDMVTEVIVAGLDGIRILVKSDS